MAHLDRLLEHVRSSGVEVALRTSGEPAGLPLGVDLSAYRIGGAHQRAQARRGNSGSPVAASGQPLLPTPAAARRPEGTRNQRYGLGLSPQSRRPLSRVSLTFRPRPTRSRCRDPRAAVLALISACRPSIRAATSTSAGPSEGSVPLGRWASPVALCFRPGTTPSGETRSDPLLPATRPQRRSSTSQGPRRDRRRQCAGWAIDAAHPRGRSPMPSRTR